tara:strand:- start:127 stop:501 length:375 start_codon:yes stop_codon:yes gene_type:complete
MKSFKILSRHTYLAEAVEAANIDLSYNEATARRDIRQTSKRVSEAFVLEINGVAKVAYVYQCDIKLLNIFEPFMSCLSSSDFGIATLSTDGDSIVVTEDVTYGRRTMHHLQQDPKDIWAVKDFA